MSYKTHGDTGTRLYRIYKSMKCRCYSKNHPTYKNYGLRGIRICDKWLSSYLDFKEWSLVNGYNEQLELDRIDVNGNYEPSNCRWINHHEQTLNRRDTLYVTVNNKTLKLRDFCSQNGISINSANNWRYTNVLDEKLTLLTRNQVVVSGGKKSEVRS